MSIILIISNMMFIPINGKAQLNHEDSIIIMYNPIIDALNIQLNLSPNQLEKINLIYLNSIDTDLQSSTDFETELCKVLNKQQKEKLTIFLNSAITRHNIKYCIKK